MASIPKLWELREVPRGPARKEWGMRELRQAMGQSQEVALLLTGTRTLWKVQGLEVQVHHADPMPARNDTTGEQDYSLPLCPGLEGKYIKTDGLT